jgi:RNA polymerase sigma-70 factor (ECF subfamily)
MMDDNAAIAQAELTACLGRVAAGDAAALDFLYQRTAAKLFGICKRILPDGNSAEDVLQEVFLLVWRKAGQFDQSRGVSPITWLAAIARNRALDRLRGRAQGFAGLDAAAEMADARPLADAALEAAERSRRLEACLSALDARAREAIRSAFFGGETYQRLAAKAAMPLATMKSLIRRGLLQLKACMEHG